MNLPNWQSHALAKSQVCFYVVFNAGGHFIFTNPYFASCLLPANSNDDTFFNMLAPDEAQELQHKLFDEEATRDTAFVGNATLNCSPGNFMKSRWEIKRYQTTDGLLFEAIGIPEYQPTNQSFNFANGQANVGVSDSDNKEDKYKFLFYKNPLPMWMYDITSLKFLEVNEAVIHHYGYSREEFLNMTLKDIRPSAEMERFMAQQQHPMVDSSIHKGVWRHVKKNGQIIDVQITAHRLDFNGRPAKLVLAEDITQQIRAEYNLLRSNERYNFASKATFDAIWDWDFNTNTVYWGEGFKILFGYDIKGNYANASSWYDHIHDDEKERVKTGKYRAIENNASNWTDEYKYIKADGTFAYVIDRGIIIRDDTGKGVRMIGAMQDITIRKVNEQQLQKINLQLLRQQKERELTASILRSLSEKEVLNDALEDILRKLTIFFKLEIGEIWFLNFDKKLMELRQKWYTNNDMDLFYKRHEGITFKFKEKGVLGKTWEDHDILFVDDLSAYESFTRKTGALEAGLTKGLAVPITFKGKLIALFSFFGKKEIGDKEKVRLYFEALALQLGIDIQRKKTEEELNNFFDLSPDILTILGVDGYFRKVNGAFTQILGFEASSIENLHFSDLLFPDDLDSVKEEFTKLETGQTTHFEHKFRTKEGGYKWLSWATAPLVDEGLIYATAKDVTDKKDFDNKLNRILESITDGFITLDKNFEILYLNRQAEKMLRLKRQRVLGKNPDHLFKPYLPTGFFAHYIEAIKKNEAIHAEEYVPALSRWYDVNAYPYEGILSIFFKDVTERKKSEEIIKLSSDRYELLAKATKDAIWDWNLQTNRVSWNEGLRTIFNYVDIAETNDSNWWNERLHPDDRDRVIGNIKHHIKSHLSRWEEEYRFLCADGSYKYVYDRGFTIYNDENQPIRMIGSMQDLSETKSNEMILKELNESLEKRAAQLATSNAELESFAYVASHDLQEPLRMVSSFLQLIEKRYKDKLDQKAHEYIRFAVDGAERMKGLILDLLEYSRVNSRKDQKEYVDLNEIAENLLLTYKEVGDEANGSIEIDPLPGVMGNRLQLTQLLQNLVGNALKYRSTAPPHIKISVVEQEADYRFAVADNGIGIEPRFFNKIFIIFQRLHNKNEYSGTGIGLAICKKIVEVHAGEIWVQSTPGQGSTFFFTLPKHAEAENAVQQ